MYGNNAYGTTEYGDNGGKPVIARVFTEVFGIASNLSRLANFTRIFTDIFKNSEVYLKNVSLKRIFIERLGVAESQIKKIIKSFTDKIGGSDSFTYLKFIVKIFTETFGATDSLVKNVSLKRIFAETFGIAESFVIKTPQILKNAISIVKSCIGIGSKKKKPNISIDEDNKPKL